MICPSKTCKAQIPDDSLYCDQCGIVLKKCPCCSLLSTGKFCGKCGSKLLTLIGKKEVNNELPDTERN